MGVWGIGSFLLRALVAWACIGAAFWMDPHSEGKLGKERLSKRKP